MKTVNKAILVGYVGADPEVRYTAQEGHAIANFSIATTEKWKDGDELREDTQWHRCVAWGKLGELAGDFLHKGSKVYVEGHMKTRKWADKENVDRYTTEVVVDEFSALDASGAVGGEEEPHQEPEASSKPTKSANKGK